MTEHNSGESIPHYSGVNWVVELYKDPSLDTVAAGDWDEIAEVMRENRDPMKWFVEKAASDPNVYLKNKLLAKLGELAESGSKRELAEDFLALLEHQAKTLDDQPEETRNRQFMGLLDVIVACFKDSELHYLFESQKDSLSREFGDIEDSDQT